MKYSYDAEGYLLHIHYDLLERSSLYTAMGNGIMQQLSNHVDNDEKTRNVLGYMIIGWMHFREFAKLSNLIREDVPDFDDEEFPSVVKDPYYTHFRVGDKYECSWRTE